MNKFYVFVESHDKIEHEVPNGFSGALKDHIKKSLALMRKLHLVLLSKDPFTTLSSSLWYWAIIFRQGDTFYFNIHS